MKKDIKHLVISEKFYSIQGEGRTMGIPAVFLRLSGCNLLCQSDSWICDTIEVWRKGVKTEFENVLTEEMVEALQNGAHLVFTGGEPLQHQSGILNFIIWFYEQYRFNPVIEVETNGTIAPVMELRGFIDYFNVSPKLSNSGEPYEKRFKIEALRSLNNLTSSIFKFVVSNEEDWKEICKDFLDLNFKKIWLMPAGSSRGELEKTREIVAKIAIENHVRYSERLHIGIWNQKTGV